MELLLKREVFTDKLLSSPAIYKITNPGGRVYVGQALNMMSRAKRYTYLCSTNRMRKLYNSFVKYGIESHVIEVIEYCNEKDLDSLERKYIDLYNSVKIGMNCRSGGREGSSISDAGRIEIGRKMKLYWKNNRHKRAGFSRKFSEAHKAKISESRLKAGISSGHKNPKAKIVLHTEYGLFYGCLKEACHELNLNYSVARKMLQGNRKNTSKLIYT